MDTKETDNAPENFAISPDLITYRDSLKVLVAESQRTFEKQLNYISAGSLSISIAFIKNVVGDLNETILEGWLITGWTFMGITLLLNLLSHVYSSNCHSKTIDEISEGKYSYAKSLCRKKDIQRINYFSISFLVAGIACVIIFIGLNI